MLLNIKVDKRFEILSGIIGAYLNLYPDKQADYDWIEIPKHQYADELLNKINITNYPKLITYIENIIDCGYYSELFLYFDNDMNPKPYKNLKKVFEKGSVGKFQSLLKNLYDSENLDSIFTKYCDEFHKIEAIVPTILPENFDVNDLKLIYGNNDFKFNITISILANGGLWF